MSHAYKAKRKRQLEDIRLLAYMNYLAHWQSKSKPPTIENYLKIESNEDAPKISNKAREAYMKQAEQYYLNIKKNAEIIS